jgi:hypothetical protein
VARLRETFGSQTVADGGTVTHGLGGAPRTVHVTPSDTSTVASVTAVSGTTFTVGLKRVTVALGVASYVAAATQTVYWTAK